ncbi:competence protein ComK [Aquibacillus saliphilus]|uniref:competence protein ComK n=1 Tax=Aquibacillus saliphilus TaxID=1909422 RepID=UPI001CF044FF|nr:competence protein ComK [Aquibacillus saliphilus]
MEQIFTKQYHISNDTMTIEPKSVENYRTLIVEPGKQIYTTRSLNQILNDSCIRSGASLDGRRMAAGKILETSKKIPVPVSPEQNIYLMPTCAIKEKECAYISFIHIKHYSEQDKKTLVVFNNGYKIIVDTSRKSFNQLYNRTSNIMVYFNYKNQF